MSNTITLDESIEVDRPLHEVFAYVADFAHIEEWDPAVQRGVRLTLQAPGTGSEYRIDMKAGFSLHYRVVEFVPGERLLMNVDSSLFTAREEIRFAPTAAGTRVRYIARFAFPAPLARLSRRFPSVMDRVGKSAVAGLKRALTDRFEPPAPSRALELGDKLIIPGLWRFTRLGHRSARRRWNPLSAWLGGRHAVVTGATSGIGFETARALAAMGATLTLVARDRSKAATTVRELRHQTGNPKIRAEIANLELMDDVNALADRLIARGVAVDMLVNNAGALFNPRQLTSEGLERSFALLLLSPYLLTERLHPLLRAAGHARVVNVLSGGMYTQRVEVEDLQNRRGAYSGSVAYARAKRALMILTEEWAGRWRDEGIVVNAMHPGWSDTPGVAGSLPAFHRLTRPILRTPAEGADTAVWLAAATEAAGSSGRLWLDREEHPSHVFAHTRESSDERALLLQQLAGYLGQASQQRGKTA